MKDEPSTFVYSLSSVLQSTPKIKAKPKPVLLPTSKAKPAARSEPVQELSSSAPEGEPLDKVDKARVRALDFIWGFPAWSIFADI